MSSGDLDTILNKVLNSVLIVKVKSYGLEFSIGVFVAF